MPTYFRDGEGKATMDKVARWLVEQAAFRGWSLRDYVEGRCSLTDFGVAAENVIATLKPRIPDAHLHYNRDTPRGKRFDKLRSQVLGNSAYTSIQGDFARHSMASLGS